MNIDRYWYPLTLLSYFALLALLLLWPTVLSPPREIPVALLLTISTVPLLLPLFGLLHRRPKALVWTAFLSLLYFTHGTMDAWAASGLVAMLALGEALLSFSLFICASFAARAAAAGESAGAAS